MQFISKPSKLSSIFKKQLANCNKIHFAVAWASIGFSEYEQLVQAKRKIGRAIIGTHFYQTAPEVIEKFSKNRNIRFNTDHSELFHPKVYLFEHKKAEWACIIGSSNFTAGGFGKNNEASLFLTSSDDVSGTVMSEVQAMIDEQWNKAVQGNTINLERYKAAHKRFKPALNRAAGIFSKSKRGRPIEEVDIINMSWNDFSNKVKLDKHHKIKKRLNVLDKARSLFSQHGTFASMSIEDRKGIAGYKNSETIEWGWFGSMRGAGEFKGVVGSSTSGFSNALEQIPLTGNITREEYLAFVRYFVKAFPLKGGKRTGHGLATATRLLAMKRPDYFVCLDAANKKQLFADFEISMNNHDYERYWDEVVERIILSDWWNARRPTDEIESKVWDGRAAMLDAIYYKPKSKK
jgi:HKD family nuclease